MELLSHLMDGFSVAFQPFNLGMMALGVAYSTGKLKFNVGDYGAMIKNPAMAGPFIKSFDVMGRVPRT